MMDSEEIEQRYGYNEHQLDEMAAEYEDDSWEGPLGPAVYGNFDEATAGKIMKICDTKHADANSRSVLPR